MPLGRPQPSWEGAALIPEARRPVHRPALSTLEERVADVHFISLPGTRRLRLCALSRRADGGACRRRSGSPCAHPRRRARARRELRHRNRIDQDGSSCSVLPRLSGGQRSACPDPGAGGDQVRLHSGDSVLWYLTSYPPPPLLELTAPAAATPGLVQVHVDQHECTTGPAPDYEVTCGASPAQGATVTGGDAPALTDSEGNAAVPIASQGHFALQAGLDADVPSESVDVCVNDDVSKCPDSHGKVIYGRPRADRFGGTPGWDVIRSGGGDDVISIRSGGRDRVDCGAGSDRVIVGSGDGDDRIGSSCERVVKR